MEQHPIPQNVTQYQFRLIGDMTIKQFAFLAGGIITAILAFNAPLLPVFVKFPLAGILAAGGAAIAFIPYEERSLDIWLINFVKSIYQPTLYFWQKSSDLPDYLTYVSNGQQQILSPLISAKDRSQLEAYLKSLSTSSQSHLDKWEDQSVQRISQLFGPETYQPSPGTSVKQPENVKPAGNKPRPLGATPSANRVQTVIFENQARMKQVQLKQSQPPHPTPVSPPTPIFSTQPLGQRPPETTHPQPSPATARQSLSPTPMQPAQPVVSPPPTPQVVPPTPEPKSSPIPPTQPPPAPVHQPIEIKAAPSLMPPMQVHSLYPDTGKPPTQKPIAPQFLSDIEMPLTPDYPNVIVGMTISKDERLIANVIIEVQDHQGLPVRAVKSNKLSQFFIATPLKDGDYKIVAEHPQYTFGTMQLTAKGDIIPPLKIIANESWHEAGSSSLQTESGDIIT